MYSLKKKKLKINLFSIIVFYDSPTLIFQKTLIFLSKDQLFSLKTKIMSNIMSFADLKSDEESSPTNNDPYNSTINGFSTIDLNIHLNDDSSINTSSNQTNSSGYTSFDQPFNATANTATTIKPALVSPKHSSSLTSGNIDLAQTGTKIAVKTANTIENIKQWSKSAYKCTRQIISERLGKTSRTIDPELEADILKLRESKKKYEQILNLSRSMVNHFYNFIQTQKSMSDLFSDLAQKSPELHEEFTKNSETQRVIFKNGECLISKKHLRELFYGLVCRIATIAF
jgi:hypothetical protein